MGSRSASFILRRASGYLVCPVNSLALRWSPLMKEIKSLRGNTPIVLIEIIKLRVWCQKLEI
jgi:hypothetical protein